MITFLIKTYINPCFTRVALSANEHEYEIRRSNDWENSLQLLKKKNIPQMNFLDNKGGGVFRDLIFKMSMDPCGI